MQPKEYPDEPPYENEASHQNFVQQSGTHEDGIDLHDSGINPNHAVRLSVRILGGFSAVTSGFVAASNSIDEYIFDDKLTLPDVISSVGFGAGSVVVGVLFVKPAIQETWARITEHSDTV